MDVKIGSVSPFDMGGMREKALKPLEEAAYVFAAWQSYNMACELNESKAGYAATLLLDDIADCIQACANLAAAVGVGDLTPYMAICEQRNMERGRYE